jgi:RNA polymerase sigma-70 factor, ECF subfamily
MDQSIIPLIEQARQGCRESLNSLAERVQDDLFSYLYRLTQDDYLAGDLRQETLIEMCKSLKDLQNAESFKPWLYKTAWRKVADHYRSTKNKSCMSIDDPDNLVSRIRDNEIEGLKSLISNEIAETLVTSLGRLEPKMKNVLVLRCYENLSYSEIARIMEISEMAARLLFFRAKDKLKSQLQRKGITSVSFLSLLCLFGQVTSPTKAAVTISASAMEVGILAATLGTILSKICLTLISLVAGGSIILGGAAILKSDSNRGYYEPPKQEIKSFHFIKQAWDQAYVPNANLIMGKSLSKGAYEKWYFFPEGVDGPLFLMMQRWDPKVEHKLCGWRLDGDGQFYYNSAGNQIYHCSSPLANKSTLRFPSDSPEFCDFLDAVEGPEEGIEYKRDPKTGLQIELFDRRFANAQNFKSAISSNNLDEKTFGGFRYKWPENAQVIDERDEIHQQGWTVFYITGTINDTAVNGQCRIPLVYNKRAEFPPLLNLNIGGERTLVDSAAGAFVLSRHGKTLACYPAGSFFKGLMRPWYGIHTIDTLRRDAAERRVPFKVENLNFKDYYYEKRVVTLYNAPGYGHLQISIAIDIDKNQIDKIEFLRASNNGAGTPVGQLTFVYPARKDQIADLAQAPPLNPIRMSKDIGVLWLFGLAHETWEQ